MNRPVGQKVITNYESMKGEDLSRHCLGVKNGELLKFVLCFC